MDNRHLNVSKTRASLGMDKAPHRISNNPHLLNLQEFWSKSDLGY